MAAGGGVVGSGRQWRRQPKDSGTKIVADDPETLREMAARQGR